MYFVHQVTICSSCPKQEHGEGIIYLVRYLKRIQNIGLKLKPERSKGFEDYCDVHFSGNWNQNFAKSDPSTTKSRSIWIIFYAARPIVLTSKLQTQDALSIIEVEYISLSMSLGDIFPPYSC